MPPLANHSIPLLNRIVDAPADTAFAVLRRQDQDLLDVLAGDVVDVDRLADIPLGAGPDAPTVLALVPFRQVRERGFDALDDGAPLRCLVVREREQVSLDEALAALPREAVEVRDAAFDQDDDAYAAAVRRVIDDEIGAGEGANFVVRRDVTATTGTAPTRAVLGWLRTLLTGEAGAHWTFAVHTPGLSLAGATPERHVGVRREPDGTSRVLMNPISGTYRYPGSGPSAAGLRAFLGDAKETEELFMVVDEEMKMMSRICPGGGHILGPYLKPMSRLAHTEYLLEGTTDLDVREVLRLTMFAPTVTGSPMQNACTVIARHEATPRGYYAGVLALFTPSRDGYELDAPILIRTAYLDEAGHVRVPAGATIVRSSTPLGEAAETRAKASGVLAALGVLPARPRPAATDLAGAPGVPEALARRNDRLAPFWLHEQSPHAEAGLVGLRALIVDGEDDFTAMLAHQLRHLGLAVEVAPWHRVPDDPDCELLVAGPGPGDPEDLDDPRIRRLNELVAARLANGRPLFAECLSHQILARRLGLPLVRLGRPRQGLQLDVDLFGRPALLGFYNTFTARLAPGTPLAAGVEAAVDPATGDVFALRGPGFAATQGHLESVLSRDGLPALAALVGHAVGVGRQAARV